ncbi:hypothetical protein FHX57_007590 [Paraburkholderia tropica]|uniref:hypothetical protein n=1 Tax=Paraburkholderia tropica TaxID=92647 RepID=UPI0011B4374B|nr:hypothetical protein [Paraburkholderia tropica]MBB2984742.1 hypothetical protein [Paraburkholderia tropica]MBB3005202.1 hypothetical protein [Paraburkholderia tropica]MBB6324128.1 hypothetical protein [Paraburkholderia tropica]
MTPQQTEADGDPAKQCLEGHPPTGRETTSPEAMPPFALALQKDSFANAKAKVILLIESDSPGVETTRVVKRQVGDWAWFDIDVWQPRAKRWFTRRGVPERRRAFEIARLRAWLEEGV